MDTDLGPGRAQILGNKEFKARIGWVGTFQIASRLANEQVAWNPWPKKKTELALVVAFLDNSRSGRFRLECVKEQRSLGLLPDRARVAVYPGDCVGPIPPSIEGELILETTGEDDVYELVHSWLRSDLPNPWQDIAIRQLNEFCGVGVLTKTVFPRWLIFSEVHYSYANSYDTSEWISAFEYGQELLANAAKSNPDLYYALRAEVERAFASRASRGRAG